MDQEKHKPMKTKPNPTLFAAALTSMLASQALAQESAADLAKKLSNPVAALISVPFQLNYDEKIGPTESGKRWLLNVQPVVPISLNENWNVISRTILPVVSQKDIFPGAGSQSGIGDIVQSVFISPKAPTAGVWATENTREAIFDAMKRKETYATTGPRMVVRFFGGWDFTAQDAQSRLPAGVGYAKGVPMGGDLRKAAAGKSPSFLVAAMKDSYSGNLDRIQIVKGWLDKDGKTREKVYDVVWSGDRKPGANGKLPPVGNTVDVAKATWKNSIGSPELSAIWTAPDFDAKQTAFYYARVIEIPTPRWTAYEAMRFGIKMSADVPMTTQERAYTWPIWYTP
jgi:hypothetical protein